MQMRRIVVALVVAVFALTTLSGCGGGGEEATTEEDAATAPAPAATVTEEVVVDNSANDSDLLPALFPSFSTTDTPAVFQDKLDTGRPMLIMFYDDAQQITATTRPEVYVVMNDYRGLIDLVTFDVGGSADDPATLAAVTYASELGAASTPYILVVDGGGFITWRSKGYAEQAILKREVERATR
jgi:hypothetical protein